MEAVGHETHHAGHTLEQRVGVVGRLQRAGALLAPAELAKVQRLLVPVVLLQGISDGGMKKKNAGRGESATTDKIKIKRTLVTLKSLRKT